MLYKELLRWGGGGGGVNILNCYLVVLIGVFEFGFTLFCKTQLVNNPIFYT
jgi:hypothetical protein